MRYRRPHLAEAKQPKGARTVKVEHSQIVSFGQICGHNVEVRAVSLLCECHRDLIREKLFEFLWQPAS